MKLIYPCVIVEIIDIASFFFLKPHSFLGILLAFTVPALKGKDYGKTKMKYPDYTETQSGLQYKVTPH